MGTHESVVPVVATVPAERQSARNRPNKKRNRGSTVAQALGMMNEDDDSGRDGSVFPDQREEGEPVSASEIDREPDVKEKPAEPANPYNQADEQGIPPSVALVAPDVTPMALIPLDSAKIPKFKETSFSTTQADAAVPPEEPAGGSALDALLARPTEEEEPAPGPPAPRVVSTEEAKAMMGVRPVSLNEDGAGGDGLGYLKPGSEMPEHKDGDVKKIMSTFRKFAR